MRRNAPEAQAGAEAQSEMTQTEEAPQEPSVEELLAAAKEENAKLQDLYMRALAEAENARRRAEESVEKAHKFGVESSRRTSCPCSIAWRRPWNCRKRLTIP